MDPIEIAQALAQREVTARGEHRRPSPALIQDPWTIARFTAAIPSSALVGSVAPRGVVPLRSVIPPEAAAIKKLVERISNGGTYRVSRPRLTRGME
jgi:hypothetical protein